MDIHLHSWLAVLVLLLAYLGKVLLDWLGELAKDWLNNDDTLVALGSCIVAGWLALFGMRDYAGNHGFDQVILKLQHGNKARIKVIWAVVARAVADARAQSSAGGFWRRGMGAVIRAVAVLLLALVEWTFVGVWALQRLGAITPQSSWYDKNLESTLQVVLTLAAIGAFAVAILLCSRRALVLTAWTLMLWLEIWTGLTCPDLPAAWQFAWFSMAVVGFVGLVGRCLVPRRWDAVAALPLTLFFGAFGCFCNNPFTHSADLFDAGVFLALLVATVLAVPRAVLAFRTDETPTLAA